MGKIGAIWKLNKEVLTGSRCVFGLFLACLVLSFVALLFSTTMMLHIYVAQYSQSVFTIRNNGGLEYGDVMQKLDTVGCDSARMSLDASNSVFVVYRDRPSKVNRGRDIDQDAYEAIVGNIENRPEIGEYLEYGGQRYQIVGYVYIDGYIEISRKGIKETTPVYQIQVYESRIFRSDIERYGERLSSVFGTEIVCPRAVSIRQLFTDSPMGIMVLGIVGISFVTTLLCYHYMFARRKYEFSVLRLIGASKSILLQSLLLEILVTVASTMLLASLVYLILERVVFTSVLELLFGVSYVLRFEYYVFVFGVLSLFCFLSAIPSMIRLMRRRIIR